MGGTQTLVTSDVRIIAATHRDIEGRIGDGLFREDLYYRLNVFPSVCPLCASGWKTCHCWFVISSRSSRKPPEFTPAALAALQAYDWPGNVRELGNLVERMGIMQPGHQVQLRMISPSAIFRARHLRIMVAVDNAAPAPCSDADLPFGTRHPDPAGGGHESEKISRQCIEISLVQQALQRTNGVVAHSAELLGLRRTTLVEKIKKYGINLDAI